jgi:hypothetical protein
MDVWETHRRAFYIDATDPSLDCSQLVTLFQYEFSRAAQKCSKFTIEFVHFMVTGPGLGLPRKYRH